jgi:hypothetical protein
MRGFCVAKGGVCERGEHESSGWIRCPVLGSGELEGDKGRNDHRISLHMFHIHAHRWDRCARVPLGELHRPENLNTDQLAILGLIR